MMVEDLEEIAEEVEEKNVEVMEFSLTNDEIDELLSKLNELKSGKEHIHFEINNENELLIHKGEELK